MENNFTDNITQFLESDKPKELLNFLSTEEENEIFNFRMGETGLTSNLSFLPINFKKK